MSDGGLGRLDPGRFWARLTGALAAVDEDASTPPPEGRVGAVLVLLEPAEDGPSLTLTRRRRDLRSHPGQVSFAGGRVDPGETIEQAALREAREEIGLDPASATVLGRGPTFYIPPSRFWVAPVVARWDRPHRLDPNPWEVDAILRVPVAHLLDPQRWRHVPLSLRGSSWAWALDGGDLLWGATAIVVARLLDAAVGDWSGGKAPEDLSEDRAVRPWEHAPSWQRAPRLEGDLPEVDQADVVHVTVAQMRAVDRRLHDLGVPLESLAEHAGRGVAHAVRRLGADAPRVTVVCGPGGNGAGGLAAARLLLAAGSEVEVLLTGEPRLPRQLAVLEAAGVAVDRVGATVPAGRTPGDVVVDAMVGIGAEPPLGGVPEVVNGWLARHDVPVVAVDLPSGLGGDVGLRGPCVHADVTVTLGAPKVGLRPRIVHPYVGDLYVADLGIPAAVWSHAGVEAPTLFERGPLVRLAVTDRAPDAGTPDQGP